MEILSAMDLKKGKKAEHNKMGGITQPIQFLPSDQKDEQWAANNLDWLEWQGLKQIKRNSKRLLKNYKLAQGIIDKSDYIPETDNDYKEIVDILEEDEGSLELEFYPIIPSVIKVLVAEFAKRNKKITFRSVDDYSFNELLENKRADIESTLVSSAELKLRAKLTEMGVDLSSEEAQQQMSPEAIKSLPDIQEFYTKDYKSMCEVWAEKQYQIDEERFKMDELEERGFRDSLITDREFWHFKMYEDDYDVELWNPLLTFYHKSSDARYISQGNYVGKIEMLTIADVIDKYGWVMTEEQLSSLEVLYPVRSAGYAVSGYQNDGSYYDATKSHDWNTNMPSLAYRQYTSMMDNPSMQGDIINWILADTEDNNDMNVAYLLRVTTTYWKSQRKVGHLTKIDSFGNVISKIVDESYEITEPPVYNTTLFPNKEKFNLVFGEHIEWTWINHVWGGVKIGPNRPSFWGTNNPGGINPIYLGINGNHIAPLKFQFKGDSTIYGSKLPVEGAVFSDKNTKSTALVDLMKPYQIGYNLVNNQIQDILYDEIGTVLLLDQNALPQQSLGEDWGKGNLAKAYVAMKNFQMLPLDTSITNTENPLNFSHFQPLNLEQTNRLLSRIQLANYFKQQAFEVIGLSPQRMGQQIGQYDTATSIEQAVSASYAQTEMYFIQHSDYLMPRVHQMRTDLAQYYHSTNPSIRLKYMTSNDERVNFEMNGTDLMLRELNVFCSTKANHRAIAEQIKQLAINNNTTGASIYDLGNLMQTDTLSGINQVLKQNEAKLERQRQEQLAAEQQAQEKEIKARLEEKQMELDRESLEREKDRRARLLEAEIKASGYGAMQDIDKNNQSDFQDNLDRIHNSEQFKQTMNLNKDKENNKSSQFNDKMALEREKLSQQKQMKEIDLEIARENKTQAELKARRDKKKP